MELVRFPSRGGFSVRSILTFAFAVLITALFWATSGSLSAHADTDAHWGGDAIIYNDHGFTEATDIKDTTGTIPDGSKIYKTPVLTTGSGASASQKVFIIYFTPGVDPPTATSAKYVEFDDNNGTLSNPQNQKNISLTDKSHQTNSSSCAIDGVGWMICPVSNFLANAMDHIFGWLAQLIQTQPPTLGDTGSSMYIAWNIMRTIANVAFVIVFLIIIYSQLTGVGVSNYGLKKLIPRLIVAAILVNISFYIAALAIDISNILGFSIQEIFVTVRKGIFHITDENAGVLAAGNNAWGTVTTVVLGAGGIVGGAYYAASGGIYLLMPLLIGLLLTIMLVFLILAARQAIILCLVIIAPIAFVANLLPNTEKWFDKWKDLFMTMLIFFPAFSLVFGASQLAGQIIIQNASSQGSVNNIVMLIFGLAVQVAPLVITPLLLKFSGGLLGRIAQIANNPRKGLIDRNRNWAQARAEHAKQRNIAQGPRLRNPASWGAAMVRRSDFSKRRLSDNTDIWKQAATNRYEGRKNYDPIAEHKAEVELEKEGIHNSHTAHIESLKARQGTNLNIRTVELENAKANAERATAQTAHMVSGYRAGAYVVDETLDKNNRLAELQRTMAENVIQTAAWKQGEEANKYVLQRKISERMPTDSALLDIAQGYGDPEIQRMGRDRAEATAVATLAKLNKDARENVITLMQSRAVQSKQSIPAYINTIFSKANSDDPRIRAEVTPTELEATLEIAADQGMIWIFDNARKSMVINQDTLDAVVARHEGDLKAKGGFHIQADPQLSLQRYIEKAQVAAREEAERTGTPVQPVDEQAVKRTFEKDLNRARLSTLSNTNSANLGGIKYGAFAGLSDDIVPHEVEESDGTKRMVSILDVLGQDPAKAEEDQAMALRIFQTLRDGLRDPSTRATMTDRVAFARKMEEAVRVKFFPDQPPLQLSDTERVIPGGGERPASMAENEDLPTPEVGPTGQSPSDTDNQQ